MHPPDTTTPIPTSTTPSDQLDDDLKFLIIPLVVIIIIMLLSALVYMMARKRRRQRLRENILSMYNFEPNEEEWDSFNSYDHASYNAMDYTTAV